jgi:hypothetical protein
MSSFVLGVPTKEGWGNRPKRVNYVIQIIKLTIGHNIYCAKGARSRLAAGNYINHQFVLRIMDITENTPEVFDDLNSQLLPGLRLSAEIQQEISAFFVTLPQNRQLVLVFA